MHTIGSLWKRRVAALAVFGAFAALPLAAHADRDRHERKHRRHHERRVVVRDCDRGRGRVVYVDRREPRYVRYEPRRYYEPRYVRRHEPRSRVSFALSIGDGRSHVSFAYWDPYCDTGFYTRRAYWEHARVHHHPCVLHELDDDGDVEYVNRWSDDGWVRVCVAD